MKLKSLKVKMYNNIKYVSTKINKGKQLGRRCSLKSISIMSNDTAVNIVYTYYIILNINIKIK